jgi:hypothetical protein
MMTTLKRNWFWPLILLLTAAAWSISRTLSTAELVGWENAVLMDVFVSIPLLFVLCYRKQLSRNTLIIRVMAMVCFGIWMATKLIPPENQVLLPYLLWLRYAGFAVLVLIELWIMVQLFKMVFKPKTSQTDLEKLGIPPFLAKLMLLEARFWRWVFGLLKK